MSETKRWVMGDGWSFLIEHERIYVYQPSGAYLIDLDITKADTLISLLNAALAELTRQQEKATHQPDSRLPDDAGTEGG